MTDLSHEGARIACDAQWNAGAALAGTALPCDPAPAGYQRLSGGPFLHGLAVAAHGGVAKARDASSGEKKSCLLSSSQ